MVPKERLLAVVLVLAITSLHAVASEHAREPKPGVLFKGMSFPKPPRQSEPWKPLAGKLPAKFASAVQELLKQGIADPRGCEYREVELSCGASAWVTGCWLVKTHAWVIPRGPSEKEGDTQFAVAWDGLVYPVATVGPLAEVKTDVEAMLAADDKWWKGAVEEQKKNAKKQPKLAWAFAPHRWDHATPESSLVAYSSLQPLKACLLAIVGESVLADRLWIAWKRGTDAEEDRSATANDPYLVFAREWGWALFDRAVGAHKRGDDVIAMLDARLLVELEKTADSIAEQRGFARPMDPGPNNRKMPYIDFQDSPTRLLEDSERRVKQGPVKRVLDVGIEKFPDQPKRIAALIRDLEVASAEQWSQPGGVSISDSSIVQALIKEGQPAVELLLECLANDRRLTRAVGFHRDFFASRYFITVDHAAYSALQAILQTETFGPASDTANRGGEGHAKAIAAEVRQFWANSKGKTPSQRWFDTLADDDAGPARWVEAAGHIVEAADVERRGQWITMPLRRPGEVPAMKGEVLRSKKNPSVSDLIAKRVPSVAAEEGGWLFAQDNAARLALDLHKWDAAAAVPSLHEQLQRCINESDRGRQQIRDDPKSAQSTQTTQLMAQDIGRLTTALAESRDVNGTKLYQTWVVKQNPATPGFNVGKMLRPIWRFPDDSNLAAAAEELFNGPKSTWRCLATANQFWDSELMASAIYGVRAFRKHLARNLNDVTAANESPPGKWRMQSSQSASAIGMRAM